MKYSRINSAGDYRFSTANKFSERVDFREAFDDIHSLPLSSFLGFYVKGPESIAPDVAGVLTSYSIDLWKRIEKGNVRPGRKAEKIFKRPFQHVEIHGSKGSGKTTFLHYFFYSYLPEKLRILGHDQVVVPIVFDMRKNLALGALGDLNSTLLKIYKFIDESIDKNSSIFSDGSNERDYFAKNYPNTLTFFSRELSEAGVSIEPIRNFGSPPYRSHLREIADIRRNNLDTFVQRKIAFLRENSPDEEYIFCLDNIDHHIPESPSKAVALIKSLSEHLDLPTLITLRENSHVNLHDNGVGGAQMLGRRFVLEKCEMGNVGAKRLNYFLSDAYVADPPLSEDEVGFLTDLKSQVEAFHGRLHGEYNVKREKAYNFSVIWEWLDFLSNGDLRIMLGMLGNALMSHHIFDDNFEKRVILPNKYTNYSDGIHVKRIKTALINGLSPYYDEERGGACSLVNLFSAKDGSDERNRMLRLKLLQFYQSQGQFEWGEVYPKFKSWFDVEIVELIEASTKIFLLRGLLATPYCSESVLTESTLDDFSLPHSTIVKFTKNGEFHLKVLVNDDVYLDEMKYSSCLPKDVYDDVFEEEPQSEGAIRKRATEKFVKYLIRCEENDEFGIARKLNVCSLMPSALANYMEKKKYELYFSTEKK